MTPTDRAEISARIDAWLAEHAWRQVIHRRFMGAHYVTFCDGHGNDVTMVSTDSREDAALLILRGKGIAA